MAAAGDRPATVRCPGYVLRERGVADATRGERVRSKSMRSRFRFWIFGFSALVVVACGDPELDAFGSRPAEPALGGASAVPLGPRVRGGAANAGGTPASSSGANRSTPSGGQAVDGADSAGASATAAGSPSLRPEADSAGAGGVAAGSQASSGQSALGGRPAASGGAAPSAGSGSAQDGGSSGDPGGAAGAPAAPASGAAGEANLGDGGTPNAPAGDGGVPAESVAGSAGAGAEPAEPLARTLWFSEYVEGTSNFKAIEISSLMDEPLAGCELQVFSNGDVEVSSRWTLEGAVAPATPFVLCTKELKALPVPGCSLEVRLNFNGNDAVVLSCDEQVIDAIGTVGSPIEKEWGSGEVRTADRTLRRACTVQQGDPVASDEFDPLLEWVSAGTDEFGDLGQHCAPGQ